MSIKWEKPSGLIIETNDMKETIVKCESLGWKRKDDNDGDKWAGEDIVAKPTRGRPKKTDK